MYPIQVLYFFVSLFINCRFCIVKRQSSGVLLTDNHWVDLQPENQRLFGSMSIPLARSKTFTSKIWIRSISDTNSDKVLNRINNWNLLNFKLLMNYFIYLILNPIPAGWIPAP